MTAARLVSRSLGTTLSAVLLLAMAPQAFAETISLPHLGGPSWCPRSLYIGTSGESVVSGIRYTANIKYWVVPGSVRASLGPENSWGFYPESYEHVVFTARLRPEYSRCVTDKYFSGSPMGTTVRRISMSGGILRYVFRDPVNLIHHISTYNNQAILTFQERL